MSLISILQEFDGMELGEDNGELIYGKLLPGLSQKELQELQALIPCRIPPHVSEALSLSRGIDPALESIDFSGLSLADKFNQRDLLPHGLPVCGDGLGNFWVLDLNPHSRDWGPVFYVCQDPAVIVYQAKTFEEFLLQLIGFASFEENSPINLVHDNYAKLIWSENPNLIDEKNTFHIGDPDLGLFAQSLKRGYHFVDLRRPRIGDGFSFGRYGKKTEIKRYGYLPLFAYRKEVNWLFKLLGN